MTDNIRALSRGLNALQIVCETGEATCGMIAGLLDLSRPTVYRLLGTLVESGLLSVDDQKIYRPTIGVRALESGLTDKAWALWAALPSLAELQKEVVWTCEIATHEDYTMVRRDSMHLENPFRIDLREFDDRPRSMLTSALGRSYLAFCPPQEADHILDHIERMGDVVDPEARVSAITRTDLETIRERGYAFEQRRCYPHVASIAAPIRYNGRVLACIAVAWIARAIKLEQGIESFLPPLMRARDEIEDRLVQDARDHRMDH